MNRNLLLTVLLYLLSYALAAQDLKGLQQQLQTAKSDKDKLYALDALANYFTWTEGGYDAAKAYGRQMISLAEQTKNKELTTLTYILNGIRLVEAVPSTEREKELRGYFEKAVQIAQESHLPFYEACAWVGLSGIPYQVVLVDGDEELQWGKKALNLSTALANDSLKAMALIAMGNGYRFKNNNVAAFHQFTEAMALAEAVNDPYLLAYCYRALARFYHDLGDFDKALALYAKATEALKKKKSLNYRDLHWLYFTQWNTTWSYVSLRDYEKARSSAYKCLELAKACNLPSSYRYAPLNQLLGIYLGEHKYEEAKAFIRQNPYIDTFYKNQDYESQIFKRKALIYQNTGQADSADYYYQQAIASVRKAIPVWSPGLHRDYGYFLMEQGKLQAAIKQFERAKELSEEFKNISSLVDAYHDLDSAYYRAGAIDKAYRYDKIYHRYKDSLTQLSKEKDIALLEVNNERKQWEGEQREKQARMVYQNRMQTYFFIGGLAASLVLAGILYRNNRQKQKANSLLQHQKQKVEQALGELKLTQAQLIQQEKVASLGQLTAGIAHEIQNPLNFVKNFSEVNKELLEELLSERKREHPDPDVENIILNDLKQNTEKIACHGKRADSIVRNMLEHSRAVKGEKQLTDVNALTDEYLRLAYHGMRAKDKSFNAVLETHFDLYAGKLYITPQDMGRVLLNLFNNAFYAVHEKKKQLNGTYEPAVVVTTKAIDNHVEIAIRDNGMGIPEKVVDKIYQPFFTTKPSGQGTGLGLSISYDIITKGHGGEMKVYSEEGKFTEFILRLPHLVSEPVQPQV
ncbi:MAG: tetratricopeptide repeat protein [Flavisolibacter sp.]|nr:tetratricopeptide repeat protein [Flavisolibacter sp.]